MSRVALFALSAVLIVAPAEAAIGFRQMASGLSQPVFLTARGNELIVAQQGGTIMAIDRSTGAKRTFFTVPNIETGGEKGLLGFAFDPSYTRNGRFYVDVTTRVGGQLVTEIRRYTNPDKGTEAPQVVIRINQPFDNHNGGWIDFGPDKKLYIAMGDGGSANDPMGNAQNLSSKLGKILRVDVSKDAYPTDPARNYTIPAGNLNGTEVFAYGLRNPFRNSFDRTTGDLWIADVGQGAREEIDRIVAGTSGQNFGWRALEGNIRTPGVNDPISANAVAPILTYDHSVGQAITGGYVYRGTNIAELSGRYVFGDFVAGKIFTMGLDGSGFTDITSALGGFGPLSPSSFGEDNNRNLYVVDYSGRVLRFQFAPDNVVRLAALAVPEPATWAMLLAGFSVTGLAVRRRRVRAAG